jgi:hypothetical protein
VEEADTCVVDGWGVGGVITQQQTMQPHLEDAKKEKRGRHTSEKKDKGAIFKNK